MIEIDSERYITIHGFEITGYRSDVSGRVPIGILVTGAADHIRLEGNFVHDLGTTFHCSAGTSSDDPSRTTVSSGPGANVIGRPGSPETWSSTRCAYVPPRTYTIAPGGAVSAAFWRVAHGWSEVPPAASSPSVATQYSGASGALRSRVATDQIVTIRRRTLSAERPTMTRL